MCTSDGNRLRFDFSRLYSLSNAFSRGALHVRPREEVDDFGLLKATVRPIRPVVFDYSSGTEPRDLVGTECPVLVLLSGRVIDLLATSRFTGWTTYPAEVFGRRGERLTSYQGLAVTGRCGPIDDSRSKRVWREPKSPKGQRRQVWLGLYFDPDTWDGSDIFSPQSTGHIFVIEPVRDALMQAGATNLDFEALTGVERIML